jgi:hypothetical protein
LGVDKLVRFFVFPFHKDYDMLLGHEFLTSIGAIINLDKNTMRTPHSETKLYIKNNHEINVVVSNDVESDKKEKELLDRLLDKYKDIFDDNQTLKPSLLVRHKIRTVDEDPVFTRNYKYPQIYKAQVDKEIEKMLAKGIIRPSKSPYNSPIWVVEKKLDASGEKKIRLVVDYRKLNAKTIEDKFPLPNIDDLIFQLGESKYYTTLDLASGFHQIEMDPDSIEKTAFSTDHAHLEWVRMPFGLRNAPPTFQRAMNGLFAGKPNIQVYLDDIIIFSKTLEEHVEHLDYVLNTLKENNLTLQPDKSVFFQRELKFLGYWISEAGIRPDPGKVDAISKITIPRTEKQIKSFLGLTGFYRKLIKDYSNIAKPLTECLKKGKKIDINNPKYKKAFETLRTCLMKDPVLNFPNFDKPFFLTTDASNDAIGAVLAQESANGTRLAIAYASRTLNPAERNLSTIEKELLSVVWATRYYRHYLYGVRFTLETDHKPLVWLHNLKEPNSKLVRWKLQLNEFDFDIKHVSGKANKVADALSRPFELNMNLNEDDQLPIISPREVSRVLGECDNANASPNEVDFDTDEWNWVRENSPAPELDSSEPIVRTMPETHNVNVEKNQLIISNNRAPVTETCKFGNKRRLCVGVIDEITLKASVSSLIPKLVPGTIYGIYMKPSHLNDQTRKSLLDKFMKEVHNEVNNITFKVYHNFTIDVEDVDEQAMLISNTHISKTAHRGINENYEYLKRRYYWPKMKQDVNQFVNQCQVCGVVKYDRNPIKLNYQVTPTPDKPFVEVQMDVFHWDKSPILTILDKFSKRLSAYKLRAVNGKEIVRKLKSYLRNNPKPRRVENDNGTEFKNAEVKRLFETHEIEQYFTSEAHHDSLGALNRCHSTLREIMRTLKLDVKDMPVKELIKEATTVTNNSINSLTKLTPNEMTFGIESAASHSESELNKINQIIHLDQYVNQLKRIHEKIKNITEIEKEARTNRLNVNREHPDSIRLEGAGYIKTTHHRKEKNPYTKVNIQGRHCTTKGGITKKIHPNRVKRPKICTVADDAESEEPEQNGDPASTAAGDQ